MKLRAVVAMDLNRGIGFKDKLPWPRLKSDMAYFKNVTMGKPVIMGRKTWQGIGRPLPGRRIIVLPSAYESDLGLPLENVWVARDERQALDMAGQWGEEVIVAGGQQVYETYRDRIDILDLAVVQAKYECDTFFPFNVDTMSASREIDGYVLSPYVENGAAVFGTKVERDEATGLEIHRAVFRRLKR